MFNFPNYFCNRSVVFAGNILLESSFIVLSSIETVLAFDGQESKQKSKVVAKKQACQEKEEEEEPHHPPCHPN